jgi:hypothetical protein
MMYQPLPTSEAPRVPLGSVVVVVSRSTPLGVGVGAEGPGASVRTAGSGDAGSARVVETTPASRLATPQEAGQGILQQLGKCVAGAVVVFVVLLLMYLMWDLIAWILGGP